MDQNPAPAQPSAFDEAVALYQQGRSQEALEVARRGLAEFANVVGAAARQLGLATEAERYWRAAIAARPDFADAHNNLGIMLQERGLLDEAENAFRQALAINPQHAGAHNNLGNVLKARDQLTQAEAAYRQALALNPRYVDAYNNLGLLLKSRGQLAEAEAAYRQALELRPEYAEARWNYSLLLLSTGRFAEGWPLYEARHDPTTGKPVVQHPSPPIPFPQWQGEPIAGKSLLIIGEQGYGDQIQFCRYVGELKRRGATRVDLIARSILVALFTTIDGVDTVYTGDSAVDVQMCDYWAFPLSIPLHCKTTLDTIPARIPYVHALPERAHYWRQRLPGHGLRVGLVWKGNQDNLNDANRSLPGLATLAPLWSVPGVAFISLQKGAGEGEAAPPPGDQSLVHLGSAIEDFADTAAIISQLDLVICVDTAVAHLAGALGRPCWVLLPASGTDWRWLLGRSDSPWYPGVMRLFRQEAPGDWAAVVQQVAHCLRNYAMRR